MSRHWYTVSKWLEQTFPGLQPETEEARQETLITLMRHVTRMQAESPRQAAKWLSTIHRRKYIDMVRQHQRDPVRQGMLYERPDEEGVSRLDKVEAKESLHLPEHVMDAILARVLHETSQALEHATKSKTKRQLRRTQAQATLLRLVLDMEANTIIDLLNYGEAISNDRLYKWVERGRDSVLLGLTHWRNHASEDEAPLIDTLEEIIQKRRADAGKPRIREKSKNADTEHP